ncbi:hypothetical protein THIARS_50345 [Thiomonas delicata]|uniref:Uncharacterized protein n=1 Tax=Thiomonas delicata TaxID=364030 RepID=A0A238D1E8_THIDL|nr:hypothetical protein THIARS_50345 [Thiomonas delicata]
MGARPYCGGNRPAGQNNLRRERADSGTPRLQQDALRAVFVHEPMGNPRIGAHQNGRLLPSSPRLVHA